MTPQLPVPCCLAEIQLISPLFPVVAAVVNWRSVGLFTCPDDRLFIAVAFDLLVDWALSDGSPTHAQHLAPQLRLCPRSFIPMGSLALESVDPAFITAPAVGAVLGIAFVEAAWVRLGSKWFASMTVWNLVILILCLWKLKNLLFQSDGKSVYEHPAFWLSSAWVLAQGIHLTFHPLTDLFLKRLSPDWILIPWFMNYSVGLLLSLALSRTFLCRKSISS